MLTGYHVPSVVLVDSEHFWQSALASLCPFLPEVLLVAGCMRQVFPGCLSSFKSSGVNKHDKAPDHNTMPGPLLSGSATHRLSLLDASLA